jgi:hypothetical protein
MNFFEGQYVVCVIPLVGYTTKDSLYTIVKTLPEAGRVSIIDDNGKECHARADRFMDNDEFMKQLLQNRVYSFDITVPVFEKGGELRLDVKADELIWAALSGAKCSVMLQRKP